ncbi:MAG: ATP-binding protein [Gammaproteobacteria bacterium]
MKNKPILFFISGKLGSGKTTLAKKLAREESAILISEDVWLQKLFPNEIHDLKDYLFFSKRLRDLVSSHVVALLSRNVSVVFDFGGNTPEERLWVKSIIDTAKVRHVLHYIAASDAQCKLQFQKRNLELLEGASKMSEALYAELMHYFVPPESSEGFILQLHVKAD